MKPKFETREEVIAYIREQTHCGLQHAQAILEFVEQNSLTLLDEFAIHAPEDIIKVTDDASLAALCAICGVKPMAENTMSEMFRLGTELPAAIRYRYAKAMLAARQSNAQNSTA